MTRNVQIKDLLQLPTAITAASFAGVLEGSKHLDTRKGKMIAILARGGDLVDGATARALDQTSDAGAIADVTADKLGMLALAIGSWRHDIVPKPILATMTAKHLVNAAATVYNGLEDQEKTAIRPPKSGKFSMAADNLSIGAFMLADELERDSQSYRVARGIGYAAFGAGLVFGAISTQRYLEGNFDEAGEQTPDA